METDMSCCGQKRAALSRAAPEKSVPPDSVHTPVHTPADTLAREPAALNRWLEYTGEHAVTVRGAVTGRLYRFDQPGARVEVAYVDSHALLAEVPVRSVKG